MRATARPLGQGAASSARALARARPASSQAPSQSWSRAPPGPGRMSRTLMAWTAAESPDGSLQLEVAVTVSTRMPSRRTTAAVDRESVTRPTVTTRSGAWDSSQSVAVSRSGPCGTTSGRGWPPKGSATTGQPWATAQSTARPNRSGDGRSPMTTSVRAMGSRPGPEPRSPSPSPSPSPRIMVSRVQGAPLGRPSRDSGQSPSSVGTSGSRKGTLRWTGPQSPEAPRAAATARDTTARHWACWPARRSGVASSCRCSRSRRLRRLRAGPSQRPSP